MIYYEEKIKKIISKKIIPTIIIKRFHNAFKSLDLTKDLTLFDIKIMKGEYQRNYYRLRKGKYRAIFYIENDDIYVVFIGKREEVYNLWE
jgi:mRNA interferase RelE/StbE